MGYEVDYIQQSFSGGEISDTVQGQVDFDKYGSSAKGVKNFVCLPQGPVIRRSGTKYIAAARNHDEALKLIPFRYSTDQAYIIAFNDSYFQFFTTAGQLLNQNMVRNGRVEEDDFWTDIGVPSTSEQSSEQAQEGGYSWKLITSASGQGVRCEKFHLESGVDYDLTLYVYPDVTSCDVQIRKGDDSGFEHNQSHTGLTTGAWNTITVSLTATATGDLGYVSVLSSAAAGTATIYVDSVELLKDGECEVETPYLEGDHIDYAQSADTLFLAQEDTPPYKLSRYAANAWFIEEITFTSEPSEWTDTNGYPRALSFHDDRLGYGGTPIYPADMWLSKSGIYDDFDASGGGADDAIHLPLNSRQVNPVLWLDSARDLLAGTTTSEWRLTGQNGSDVIAGDDYRATVGSNSGSSQVKPVLVDNVLIHCLEHGKLLNAILYDFNSDSLKRDELTVLAEHLTRHYGIVSMSFQRHPYKVLWCVRSDGALLGLTYYREHKVYGWHVHEIAGGSVEDVAVIPGDDEDFVFLAVRRTIGGATKRYLEQLQPFFKRPDYSDYDYYMDSDTTDAWFVDSGLMLDNRVDIVSITAANPAIITVDDASGWSNGDTIRIRTCQGLLDSDDASSVNGKDFTLANLVGHSAELQLDGADFDATGYTAHVASTGTAARKTTAVSGLDHLEGETVSVHGDGMHCEDVTVSGGAVTLAESVSVAIIGKGFVSDLQSLTPRLADAVGTMQGLQKQIHEITIRVFDTVNFRFGRDEDNLIQYDPVGDQRSGHPIQCYSGDIGPRPFKGHYNTKAETFIRQDSTYPCCIVALVYYGSGGG